MRPFLLILDGPTGAGKTTSSELVHQEFPRTALLGMDRLKWSVSNFKRDHRNNEMINTVVLATTRAFLEQRVNVIVEQGFRDGWVEQYLQLGEELQVKTVTIQLVAPRDVLLGRISERNKKPHARNVPHPLPSRVLSNIRKHAKKSFVDAKIIDSSNHNAKQVAAEIIRSIRTGSTEQL